MILFSLRRAVYAAIVACALGGSAFAVDASAATPRRVPDNPLAAGSSTCQQLVAQQTALGSVNYPDAVQYYDLENSTPVDPDLTDQFLVTCSSNCGSPAIWASVVLRQPLRDRSRCATARAWAFFRSS